VTGRPPQEKPLPTIWRVPDDLWEKIEGCEELGGVNWEWASSRRSDRQSPFWGPRRSQSHRSRKNGVKRSYLVEADGGLLSVVAAEANARDDKLLEATLDVR
jgi:hypothetical protein